MSAIRFCGLALLLGIASRTWAGGPVDPSPTETPTETVTESETPTASPTRTPSPTPTPSRTPTPSKTPTPSRTPTPTPSPTASPRPWETAAPTPTFIPIVNYGVYYEPLMEFGPSPAMTVDGKVHCNSDAYLSCGQSLDFLAPVTVAGSLYWGRSPLYSSASYQTSLAGQSYQTDFGTIGFTNGSVQIPMNTGTDGIDAHSPGWAVEAVARWNGNVRDQSIDSPHYQVYRYGGTETASLRDLIARLTAQDNYVKAYSKYEMRATLKIMGAADGSVTVLQRTSSDGVYPGTYVTVADTTYADPRGAEYPRKSIVSSSTFYDSRERKRVASLDIDLGNMAEAYKGGRTDLLAYNGILYATNEDRTSPAAAGVVRLVNCAELPYSPLASGFSAASDGAIYIKGNYNTVTPAGARPRPLSLIAADAIMILSNAWQDSNAVPGSVKSVGNRVATATTTNAVFIAGNVPSGSDSDGNPGTQEYNYSGGADNLLRYLETWSGVTHTLEGSIICLFQSERFTGRWNNNSDIYLPPQRVWTWNTNILNNGGPPGGLYLQLSPQYFRSRGDFDQSRCTGTEDFMILLDHWQDPIVDPPLDIHDFLALVDHWETGLLCGN